MLLKINLFSLSILAALFIFLLIFAAYHKAMQILRISHNDNWRKDQSK